MGEYETNQIDGLLKEGWSQYKIKIASEDDQTNWMWITPAKLKKIRSLLK